MFQDFYAQSEHLAWPLLGLRIFEGSFVAVLVYVLVGLRNPERVGRIARLPLEPDCAEAPPRPDAISPQREGELR